MCTRILFKCAPVVNDDPEKCHISVPARYPPVYGDTNEHKHEISPLSRCGVPVTWIFCLVMSSPASYIVHRGVFYRGQLMDTA